MVLSPRTFLALVTSPKLYWVHSRTADGGKLEPGHAYQPNVAEQWGQNLSGSVRFILELALYTSPLVLPIFYRRMTEWALCPRVWLGLSAVYTLGVLIRTVGRLANPVYVDFVTSRDLPRFDCDFWFYPVDFESTSAVRIPPQKSRNLFSPKSGLAWVMLNTFGLKLIYPGSTKWFLQPLIAPALAENRAKLVSKSRGTRIKLRTFDKNDIDAMFFDRRTAQQENGKKLVIVSEGNAGFYELGMLNTALDNGFSALGWNHPGFWGSTGSPLPSQELHAADAVFQFALSQNFDPEDILVYGWSIGGFPTSFLAMKYPKIGGVILDATFDSLLPLAENKLGDSLASMVKTAVEENINLDVAQQIVKYPGPVRLIRRLKDEMISVDDGDFTTNRGNDLLVHLLKKRYPKLFQDDDEVESELRAFLYADIAVQMHLRSVLEQGEMSAFLESFLQEFGSGYPMNIGEEFSPAQKVEMAKFLACKYLTDFDAGHNMPLPKELFILPWSPTASLETSKL